MCKHHARPSATKSNTTKLTKLAKPRDPRKPRKPRDPRKPATKRALTPEAEAPLDVRFEAWKTTYTTHIIGIMALVWFLVVLYEVYK